MDILKKIFRLGGKKEKSLSIETTESNVLTALFNGEDVTKDKALEIPVVNSAINYITNQISSIPIALYRIKEDNTIERVSEDEDIRVKRLNGDTGDTLDCHQMWKSFVTDYLLDGNGYIYINKHRNKVVSYHYVDCRKVSRVTNNDPIFKDCYYYINGERYEDEQFIKILRSSKDGVYGRGILQENTQILAIAYNLMVFTGRMVKNGGNKKGFLKLDKNHAEPEMKRIKEGWRNFYNAENGENMLILNAGMDFKESSNTAVELQLNENRKAINDDVLLLFGLSDTIINGTAKDDVISGTFKTTIFPILHAIETALNKSNLLESEKSTYYWAFDTTEILKDDIKTRFEAYKTAIEADFMQVDEVRRIENMSPLGLNFIKLGLNDVLYYPNTGEVYTPNTNQTTRPNQEE